MTFLLRINDVFAGRYLLKDRIGSGGYSDVWLAADQKTDDMLVALKIFAPGKGVDTQGLSVFRKEYALVFKLTHPNLLRPSHYDDCDNVPYLVMPYCEKGSAARITGEISEKEMASLTAQIGSAINYLHTIEPPIIHQDIKPDNILINAQGQYLLTDFGISTRLRNTLTKSAGKAPDSSGTLPYMGPERFGKFPNPTRESDIWAFGATLYELLTGNLPFGEHGGTVQKAGADIPDMGSVCSPGLAQLIEACLHPDPAQRPTAAQLVAIAKKYEETGEWDTVTSTRYQSSPLSHRQNTPLKPTPMSETPVSEALEDTIAGTSSASVPVKKPPKEPREIHISKTAIYTVLAVVAVVLVLFVWQPWHASDTEALEVTDELIAIEQARLDSIAQADYQKIIDDSIAAANKKPATTESPTTTTNTKPAASSFESELGLQMVYVKGGTFTMGSPSGETNRESDEMLHTVTVSNFYMAKYEVTFDQYDAFCNATNRTKPSDSGWGRGKRPVINVSWNDATAYCEWLSQKTGKTYRLPTEAEWEYACRAGTTTPFNTGSCLNTSQANYDGNYPLGSCSKGEYRQKTLPVGSFSPNALGLYDMHGNVWEWCSDWYGDYSTGSQTNPKGPSSGSDRLIRGGSWYNRAQYCRSATRNYGGPAYANSNLGFRVVRVP